MKEHEIENKKIVCKVDNSKKIELERWFKLEYPRRLNTISRYVYLGLTPPETRYALEMEAYKKENELRKMDGLEPLPPVKFRNLI